MPAVASPLEVPKPGAPPAAQLTAALMCRTDVHTVLTLRDTMRDAAVGLTDEMTQCCRFCRVDRLHGCKVWQYCPESACAARVDSETLQGWTLKLHSVSMYLRARGHLVLDEALQQQARVQRHTRLGGDCGRRRRCGGRICRQACRHRETVYTSSLTQAD